MATSILKGNERSSLRRAQYGHARWIGQAGLQGCAEIPPIRRGSHHAALKSEDRNPKPERRPKSEIRGQLAPGWGCFNEVALDSDFGFRPSFGLRYSCFGLGTNPTGFRASLSGFARRCESACVNRVRSHNASVLKSGMTSDCVPGPAGNGRDRPGLFARSNSPDWPRSSSSLPSP